MGTINVTPSDLEGAAATLQRAGGGLSQVGGRTMDAGAAGDLGTPDLDQAVVDLCDRSLEIVMALWNAVSLTGTNLAASATAYQSADRLGPH